LACSARDFLKRAITGFFSVIACAGGFAALVFACGPSRDVTTPSRDTIGVDAGGAAPDQYVYVARKPHGAIGLAEARGMSNDDARTLVDHIANDFEACASRLETQKELISGAARVVAVADKNGTVSGLNVKVSSGSAQNALLCLIAPVRATNFPGELNAPQRAIAIEATWAKVGGKNAVDGG
jgi:hypothetical protein